MPRKGRPRKRPAVESARSQGRRWRLEFDDALRFVAYFAARLVTGLDSALINDLGKDDAAAERMKHKRIVEKSLAVLAGEPVRKRGRPRK